MSNRKPERQVDVSIAEGVNTIGYSHLLHIVLDNFLNNAWKYSRKVEYARIEFGEVKHDRERVY